MPPRPAVVALRLDAAGERVEAIVAEVNNTPWGEQHCYVLDARGSGAPWRFALEKVKRRKARA